MPPPINQEFSHQREPSQSKLVKEPSGIPNELFYGSTYEQVTDIRQRDRSPVDVIEPFRARTQASKVGARPSSRGALYI